MKMFTDAPTDGRKIITTAHPEQHSGELKKKKKKKKEHFFFRNIH